MHKAKIILDIIMTILIIILMKISITGLKLHEIIGIIIFFLFIIHKILNYKYFKSLIKNFSKIKLKQKIIIILDIILFIFITLIIISGIFISKSLFSFFSIKSITNIKQLHTFFSWWTLIIISIHIGFHIQQILSILKRKLSLFKTKTIKYIIFLVYLIFAFSGIISLSKYSIYSKLFLIQNNNKNNYIIKENHYHKQYRKQNKNKNQSKSNILDTINILVLFSGSTYYVINLIESKKIIYNNKK